MAMAPVSSPSSIFMMVTPLSASPAMMARLIGAAPRQRGSSEACRLKQPSARRLQNRLGQDQPVGDDHRRIGVDARGTLACASSSRSVFGVSTGIASRRASRSTGVTLQLHAAAGRLWRARIDRGDLVPARGELDQRRHREIGRAHEDQAHQARVDSAI